LDGEFGRDERHDLLHDGSWQIGHQENSRSKAGHFATSLPLRGAVCGAGDSQLPGGGWPGHQ
jgi:hypothetical protein